MRWLWWAAMLVVPGGLIVGAVYAVGKYVLKREGYRWLGVSPMYDGKQPYEEWARKMEEARRIQEAEE